jgi:hypothetical protein
MRQFFTADFFNNVNIVIDQMVIFIWSSFSRANTKHHEQQNVRGWSVTVLHTA